MTKYSKAEQEEAKKKLAEWIKPGDELFTTVTHVARSGMSRSIRVFQMENNQPSEITYWVARLLDESIDQTNGGLKVGGAGMDMGFEIVYRMGYRLFTPWECVGDKCPSNEHVNNWHGPKGKGVMHSDGGYSLRQRWL